MMLILLIIIMTISFVSIINMFAHCWMNLVQLGGLGPSGPMVGRFLGHARETCGGVGTVPQRVAKGWHILGEWLEMLGYFSFKMVLGSSRFRNSISFKSHEEIGTSVQTKLKYQYYWCGYHVFSRSPKLVRTFKQLQSASFGFGFLIFSWFDMPSSASRFKLRMSFSIALACEGGGFCGTLGPFGSSRIGLALRNVAAQHDGQQAPVEFKSQFVGKDFQDHEDPNRVINNLEIEWYWKSMKVGNWSKSNTVDIDKVWKIS